jgi:hypothetical protein
VSGHLEHEVKLDADPDLVVPVLDGAVTGLLAVERPTLTLDATYFDAADGRLLEAGVTVRRRTGEGTRWTVKLPAHRPAAPTDDPAGASGVSRQEIDVFETGLAVPPEVVDHVAPWLLDAELVAVARLVSTRRRLALTFDLSGADPAAELDDDLVAVHRPGGQDTPGGAEGPAARFRELEVEQTQDGDRAGAALEAVVGRLLAAGARPAPATSKVARALGLLAPS